MDNNNNSDEEFENIFNSYSYQKSTSKKNEKNEREESILINENSQQILSISPEKEKIKEKKKKKKIKRKSDKKSNNNVNKEVNEKIFDEQAEYFFDTLKDNNNMITIESLQKVINNAEMTEVSEETIIKMMNILNGENEEVKNNLNFEQLKIIVKECKVKPYTR